MSGRVENESRAWVVCAFLFLATALNYMDRQTLAVVAPLIQRDLQLDNAQLGLLLSAFFYTYGLMQPVVGSVLDRVDVRLGYALAVAWWSLAGLLTGLGQVFSQLFACRLMLGMGEAANWPAALRIVSRLLPTEKRSLANGFFNSGGTVGAIITPPLMVWLATRWNWRMAFVAIGLLGALWFVGWLAFTRNLSAITSGEEPPEEQPPTEYTLDSPTLWGAILRSRPFWGLAVASMFINPAYYFYSNWLPSYFVQERGFLFDVKFGGSLTLPFVGFSVGSLLGGVPVFYLSRRGVRVAASRKLMIAVATVLMLLAVGVPWIRTTAGALGLIFMLSIGMGSWQANYLSFVQEVSYKHVAAVSGIIGSFGAFSGALFIWLVGQVTKMTHDFGVVFAALAIMPLLAALGILVIMSDIRPRRAGLKFAN